MKKLMIAAAAAAMIGGAEAKIAVYDFVANLVTTVGQPGENMWDYKQIKLGQDAGATMWYSDTEFLTADVVDKSGNPWVFKDLVKYPHLKWYMTTSLVSNVPYPSLKIERTEKDVGDNGEAINLLTDAETTLLENLAKKYGFDSYGIYCCQLEFWTKKDKVCYRVTGADQISMKVALDTDNCCTAEYAFFGYDATEGIIVGDKVIDYASANFGIRNGFAAPSEADARGIEIYARVGEEDAMAKRTRRQTYLDPDTMLPSENAEDGDAWKSTVNTAFAKLPFAGWLAGQGWQQDQDGVHNLPITITGNIVGYTEAPECIDCCVKPLPKALAFPCEVLTDDSAHADVYRPNTAAFGAFYIQYAGMHE